MKAYMSDKALHVRLDDAIENHADAWWRDHPCPTVGMIAVEDAWRAETLGRFALDEARAILAETEPLQVDWLTAHAHDRISLATKQSVQGTMRRALAESLATFANMEAL
jgi:GNAT superfamily N-acetyltransferase